MISTLQTPARATSFKIAGMALAASAALLAGCGERSAADNLGRRDAKYAMEVLDKAPEHGFPAGAFNIKAIHAADEAKDPKASALLRAAVIQYARAQHGQAIAKGEWPAAWGQRPSGYDAEGELKTALSRAQFRRWLDDQAPKDAAYVSLQQAYATSAAGGATPQGEILRANLERLRWLPRETPATRVDVNIASATMAYIVDGQQRLTMRTASGKPGDETPTLTSKIDNIVLNPPWNVPDGIAQNELLPKGPEYLASHGFTTNEDGRLVQQPGAGSSLGLVKFDFDNPYAVYLHDTPAKAAFDRAGRAVSHGCVRLEHAIDLANLLLEGQAGWSAARIEEVIASGETTTVKLAKPVTVRLMYLTAVPYNGQITYLPDVYGWDPAVTRRLDRAVTGARA